MGSERNEVSIHEVHVYRAIRSAARWLSSREIAATLVGKVAYRTVRAHATKLHLLGLVDLAEVFPGHRYRWAEKADKRQASYLLRLEAAAEAFGLE